MKKYFIILFVAVILSDCGAMNENPTALPTVKASPIVFPAQVTLTPASLPTTTATLVPTLQA